MRLHFKLINGEEQDFTIDKPSFTIGRSSQADIVIPHDGMSRKHCFIENVGGKLFITDLGSMNGVFLDEKRIQPDTAIPLPIYLNLSFGAVQSLQIDMEDNTRAYARPSTLNANTAAPAPVEHNQTTTATTLLPKKTKKPKAEIKPAAKKDVKFNVKNMFFFALTLTFIVTMAFYFIREKMAEDEPMTPEEMYE